MTHEASSGSRRVRGDIDARGRVATAMQGIVPASIAMPFVLRNWAPTGFTFGWLALYLGISAVFSYLVLTRQSVKIEQTWPVLAALLYCAVPISAVYFAGDAEHFWMAAFVGIAFIAFELAALPFLRISEWRIGVGAMGLTLTICGFFVIHPLAASTILVLTLAMVRAADRIRKLRVELEDRLAEAEYTLGHDPLTDLLNRRGLETLLNELSGHDITIALIDVDRFKLINDSHGHDVGDQVLIALGRELCRRLGEQFSLARIGGDEFVAVAAGEHYIESDAARSQRIAAKLHRQTVSLQCGFSIGVSYGRNTDGAQRLLSEASFAMRQAKRTGNTVSRFGDQLAEQLDRTIQVAAIANGTSEHGAFVPVAQTIVSNDSIVGCELLIRWERPNGDVLMPDQFLSMAADAGLMSTINEVMLEHAVRFAARFNAQAASPFVSVNITASHLGEANFVERVRTLLEMHSVTPERLMVEITETEELVGYSAWQAAALELRDLGVRLAIDDFGTGYSSIERLQQLPITHVKFDRSLVQTVSGPVGQISRGVAAFAHAVNIGVIAEGIETLDELESMRAFDISMFQGFYFHKPQPLDQVELLVLEENALVSGELRRA